MNLRFTRTDFDNAPDLESFDDHTIFQTRQWVQFISVSQNAEPVIAILRDDDRIVGQFTGLIIKKYGLRILGSPFPGWTTSYLGFNLKPSIPRTEALLALNDFAFRDLKCVHIELMDRRLSVEEVDKLGYKFRIFPGYEIDLTRDEDAIFGDMESACRRCVRKADKVGVQMEVANDMDFADDFYSQLLDVYAKQKLVPMHSVRRVKLLIEHLLPTGQLLLLRARDSAGACIATGIFPAMNDTMYFWGGASWRPYQILRPNEAIQWYAMRYWKAKGIAKYDMGGGGHYKQKYGGYKIGIPWVRKSKYEIFENLRLKAQKVYAYKQKLSGLRKK